MPISKTGGGGGGGGGGGDLTLIATVTRATTGPITFAAIPPSYSDLILVGNLRGASANGVDPLLIYFNGDETSTNYDSVYVQGAAGGPYTGEANNSDVAHFMTDSAAHANQYGYLEVTVPGYSSTVWNKVCYGQSSMQSATLTSISVLNSTVWWSATDAITQIDLVMNDSPNTFLAGSNARLYGRT
jgi:hypothetical protein